MSEEKYQKVAQSIVKAGRLPFPINNTLLEILRILIDEDELDFIIKTYKRKFSLTLAEIKKRSGMEEEQILHKIESLAKKGVIFNQPKPRNNGLSPVTSNNGRFFRIYLYEDIKVLR